MSCNQINVYWAGTSFAAATTIFTDPNLQTIAPDGWYSVGLISREMVAGILGAPVTCPECDISCDTIVSGAGGIGEYRSDVLLGNDTGAVIIRFNNYSIPDKCTWTYDGVSASEYSTALFGYMQGMNFIMASIMYHCNEEVAFWVFVQLI